MAEAAAQSTPVHALTRDGAAEAAAEFDGLGRALGMVLSAAPVVDPDTSSDPDTTQRPRGAGSQVPAPEAARGDRAV